MSVRDAPPRIFRQATGYVLAGLVQLALDWAVFVLATWLGMPPAPGNIAGRLSGALLGFWLNGRYTFAGDDGRPRLGWPRFIRFAALWLLLTAASTALVSWIAAALGLPLAWLAKPLVEAMLAVVAFFLWRHVVYR